MGMASSGRCSSTVEGELVVVRKEEGVDGGVWEGYVVEFWKGRARKSREADPAGFSKHEDFAGGDDAVDVSHRR